MSVMAWIGLRSFRTYFFRPVGWFLIAGFMAITGWYFAEKIEVAGDAQLVRSMFFIMEHLSILIVPLLAMGTLAGERQDGTLETLLTAPVRTGEVVVGKFAGVFLFYLFLMMTSIPLVLILRTYGSVDIGPVVSGYAGTALAGGSFLALGMLFSALCDRALMAALFTFLIIFVLRLTPTFTLAMDPGPVRDLLLYLHYRPHLVPFRQGVVDTRHLVYFLSAMLLFLSSAVYVMTFRSRAS
jgi:ABC-2 type transport system permease protein